jgi:hypothetical protein
MKWVMTSVVALVVLAGCGFDVQSPDVFLFTRTGTAPGHPTLSLLVNNGGTARCNGGKSRSISSAQLISARDLSDNLSSDATSGLTIKPTAGTVYTYAVRMQQGTVRFPDVAGRTHKYLAQAELYFVQAMLGICNISA